MSQAEPAPAHVEDVPDQGQFDQPVEDALHALAQPLTALSIVLDLACPESEPELLSQTLECARSECRRAIAALELVRASTNQRRTSSEGRNTPIGKQL